MLEVSLQLLPCYLQISVLYVLKTSRFFHLASMSWQLLVDIYSAPIALTNTLRAQTHAQLVGNHFKAINPYKFFCE